MTQHRGRTVFWFAGILVAGAIVGCQDGANPGPRVTGVQVARNGSQDPEVTGADPTGAPQDTTLDVEVSGSGFDDGSTVQLTLAGVPTDKVRTNSTRYRNPKTLIANVTIAADADVDFYDVEVTTASRKKGIGSEMFEVFTGGGNEVMVEFVRPPSEESGDFFAGVGTLDYVSAPQPVQGTLNQSSIQTKPTPFTLGLESTQDFYDGKGPNTDPKCETGFLEALLAAAEANGGALDGMLEITASWDATSMSISTWFTVVAGDWEYILRAMGATTTGGSETSMWIDSATTLAARDGAYIIGRRPRGRKGGAWGNYEQCAHIMDFEVRVRN